MVLARVFAASATTFELHRNHSQSWHIHTYIHTYIHTKTTVYIGFVSAAGEQATESLSNQPGNIVAVQVVLSYSDGTLRTE